MGAVTADLDELRRERSVDDHHIHHELFIAAPRRKPGATEPVAGAALAAVTLTAGGQTTELEMPQESETELDAAMRQRNDLLYSCLGGACGTCRAKPANGDFASFADG